MAKIGIIISSFFAHGGEQRVVSIIANELSLYHDIIVYSYEDRHLEVGNKQEYDLCKSIVVETVKPFKESIFHRVIKALYFYTGLTTGKVSQCLLKRAIYPQKLLDEWVTRLNREQFDIIIAISGRYTLLLGYIADQLNAKCISWEHSSFEGYFDNKTGYYRNRMQVYKQCAERMENIVVLNNDIASKYWREMGLKTTVIYNPKSFSSTIKADVLQKCFVTCGRLEREKGYDDLIKAFTKFIQKHAGWKLLIIGGGSMEHELWQLINKNHLQEMVEITGYTQDVQKYLLQGSIFMMTSRWEGFPMTVTEALEMGLPIIAYDIPAMEPLVTNGVEGRIVPAFVQDKLVEAMEELALNESLRQEMAHKALMKADILEPNQIAKQWLKLIESLSE